MAARTTEEREKLLDLTEDLMLRGFDRPTMIARNLSTGESMVDVKTAKRYIALVEERWHKATAETDRKKQRTKLIRQAEEAMRRGYSLHSACMNGIGGAKPNTNGAAGAMRIVLDAQARIAKLQGFDSEKIEHSFSEETLEQYRRRAIEESLGELEEDAIRVLRGVAPPDSRQGGTDSASAAESTPAAHA